MPIAALLARLLFILPLWYSIKHFILKYSDNEKSTNFI
jgi:hypothetical protein